MNPGEQHNDSVGGMKSASGSDGSLADRPGSPGFGSGQTQSVSGSATSEPDRSAAGFETPR
jgi:hypothetical protein